MTNRKAKTAPVGASGGKAPAMTEKALLASIKAAAEDCGWMVYHTFNSRFSPAGFPDLVMVRGQRIIFAELKAEKGVMRPGKQGKTKWIPGQQDWLDALKQIPGAEVHVWRPADLEEAYKILMGA